MTPSCAAAAVEAIRALKGKPSAVRPIRRIAATSTSYDAGAFRPGLERGIATPRARFICGHALISGFPVRFR